MRATRVLCLVHGGFSSHTVRVLEIAKHLRIFGRFEILFSGSGPYMELVDRAGFHVEPTPTIPAETMETSMRRLIPNVWTAARLAEFYPVEEALLQRVRPEIVLRDHGRELASFAARRMGIYDVLVTQASTSPYLAHDDDEVYKMPGLPLRLRRLLRTLRLGRVVRPMLKGSAHAIMNRDLGKLARRLGLGVRVSYIEGAAPDLVLLCDPPHVFSLHQPPASYRFIGPLLVAGRCPRPEWFDAFIADPRPKILVSCGTTGNYENTPVFAEALGESRAAVAFHTVTPRDGLPENFYGNGPFCYRELLPHVDLFINHGGLGSVYWALTHGIPMICLFGHMEQFLNARAAARLGVARCCSRGELTPSWLRKAAWDLLESETVRQRAREEALGVRRDTGAERGARAVVEGYLAAGSRRAAA